MGDVSEKMDRRPRLILYIEDNPLNQRLMAGVIAKREHLSLIMSEHPVQGIELALSQKPDVILLDINLPEMSGHEVLARLRQEAATRATPVIAVSANAMPDQIATAMANGFDAYVTKPIKLNEFFAVLDEVLSRIDR